MLTQLLIIFLILKMLRQTLEWLLGRMNRSYYQDPKNLAHAQKILNIQGDDLQKSLAYSNDRYRFGTIANWVPFLISLVFIALGGLGWAENLAKDWALSFNGGELTQGLLFFAILGFLSFLLSLPFDCYATFVVEEKHGFNRQTPRGYVLDTAKSLVIGSLLGGLFLSGLLKVMSAAGETWWIWAWVMTSGFSLVVAWLYPTFLAPIFNKFTPLSAGKLQDEIEKLAKKVGFLTDGIFVMDASKRSSHGNAYFTGVFGKKRIVLFDTLIQSMSEQEVVAVLAHELGHFKLNHVRWGLIRGIATTGMIFYALSLCLPLKEFYEAFQLSGVSTYGALVVFSLWIGTLDFYLSPLSSWISRRNEFAADAFALTHIEKRFDLAEALLKLRESNKSLPISHPWYSAIYHSHPPILERLQAMGYNG